MAPYEKTTVYWWERLLAWAFRHNLIRYHWWRDGYLWLAGYEYHVYYADHDAEIRAELAAKDFSWPPKEVPPDAK